MRLIEGFVSTTTAVEEVSSPISECINNSQLSRCRCRRRLIRRRRRNCHQQGRHHLLHSYPPIISHNIEYFEEMFGRNSDFHSLGEITALPTSTTTTGDATIMPMSSIQMMIDRTAAGFVGSSFLNFIISPEGGDDSKTLLILAGLSVVISMASLILSIQTTLRQREVVERGKDPDDVESSSSFSDPSNKSSEHAPNNNNNNKTMKDLLKKKNLSSPYDGNDDIKSSNVTSITTTDAIEEERATIENQVLATTTNPRNELTVKPIGIVRSIYRLCVGTPRQGLLSPHARGRIELNQLSIDIAKDAVSELESFSHIWILFVFHLNTISKNQKPKISPPALGGKKVGVLATRSPHRFNPIGITLAKLDHVEIKGKQIHKKNNNQVNNDKRGSSSSVILHISGLDLVDGTPVLDIKPYVPTYDSVNPFIIESNYMQQQQQNKYDHDYTASSTTSTTTITTTTIDDIVKVPSWVSDGLATRRNVTISESAKQELERILDNDYDGLTITTSDKTNRRRRRRLRPKLDFYGPNYFNNECKQDAIKNLLLCIEEVLSIDVRSNWQTKKARQGRSIAQRSNRIIKNKKNNTQQKKHLQQQDEQQQQQDNGTLDDENDDDVIRQTKIPPASTTSSTQQLDNLLIHFTITESSEIQRVESEGSGAEDQVYVTAIELL